jgi:hypothetical protein
MVMRNSFIVPGYAELLIARGGNSPVTEVFSPRSIRSSST